MSHLAFPNLEAIRERKTDGPNLWRRGQGSQQAVAFPQCFFFPSISSPIVPVTSAVSCILLSFSHADRTPSVQLGMPC